MIESENKAKDIVGREIYEWINAKDFHWSDRLPYSFQQGWTTGWMSLICEEDGLVFKTVEELERHYAYCKKDSHWFE